MDKIKVAIVEDDPVWLSSLTTFLNRQGDLEVISTASNKDDAVEMAKNNDMDVILMDINLTENKFDGIYAASEIYQEKKVKIIMLTSLTAEEIIKKSFMAGAVNYVSKDNYTEIPSAIRSVYNRNSPFEVLLQDYWRLKESEQTESLTPAEKELLDFIEKGYTQTQISNMLYKTPGTLKCQVNKILKKMGVKSTKEAIKKIKNKGLI